MHQLHLRLRRSDSLLRLAGCAPEQRLGSVLGNHPTEGIHFSKGPSSFELSTHIRGCLNAMRRAQRDVPFDWVMAFLLRRGKRPKRPLCAEDIRQCASEGRRAQRGVSLRSASRISWSKGKRSASVPRAATTLQHSVFLKPMVTSATRSLSHLSVAF